MAGRICCVQHRTGVALHDPHECALRNRRYAGQRAVLEIATTDEADLLLARWTALPQRMRESQAGETLGVQIDPAR